MSSNEPFRIRSVGDLEVAVLHEGHALLADLISPDLYKVVGELPDQMISFRSQETFHLFAIRVGEFLSEARANVEVDGAPSNLSLLSGLDWLAPKLNERAGARFRHDFDALRNWLSVEDPCRVWCPGLDAEVTFFVSRRQLWSAFGNTLKHSFLRLQQITGQLTRWAAKAGYSLEGSDVLQVLDSFSTWLAGYCAYHASRVAELMGHVFASLNSVIEERWVTNGKSNDSRLIRHPEETSVYFQDLHTAVLVFKRYGVADRILPLVPATSANYQQLYHP